MKYNRNDIGAERIATLDIETTGFEPEDAETVAIGVGFHERGSPGDAATYDCFYRHDSDDEADMIQAACDQLHEYEADLLVTYNGTDFDLPFLAGRLERLADSKLPLPFTSNSHVDLFADRKAAASKWPKLEECVGAYEASPAQTHWNGTVVDGGVFAEELAPAYLDGLAVDDTSTIEGLRPVIEHYLKSDLENNWLIYYGDIGESFEPAYAGTEATFNTTIKSATQN